MLLGTRDGETITADDKPRLDGQMLAVFNAMADGEWHAPRELERLTASGWASVGARLRDLRKPRFGGYNVERRSLGNGFFEYRLLLAVKA